ncbi:helix-turn-helix domain-containing protein [Campylobacter concisus]|uniref:helix-turn-helix domain-containing protein n=1 Tax=Campylobacter concisus TaxID=199 RepID=UPI000CD8992C|nr:helix-turn-helix domain-containing protein [Campylobacter concisus]
MSDNLQNGYAICFNSWLFDKRIENELRLLLSISNLSAKTGYCYANNEYLGELLGKSKDTISAGVTKLKNLGYIEVEDTKFGAVVTNRKIKIVALEKANQSPTENLPSADGEKPVADGKSNVRERQIQCPPYNVCARMNNTNSDELQALKIQANNNPLPPEGISLPDFIDPNLWQEYLAYKKERREKLSTKGIEMKFSEWAKWARDGIDVNACIREAMANEWQGVFKPKPDKNGGGRNVPNNAATNPHGLNQGTLNTMRAFREFEAQLIASGQGHRVGGNYDDK